MDAIHKDISQKYYIFQINSQTKPLFQAKQLKIIVHLGSLVKHEKQALFQDNEGMSVATPYPILHAKSKFILLSMSKIALFWVVTNDLDSSSYSSHVSYILQLEDWSAP